MFQSRSDILKGLIPGLIPLLVFILADSIWGTKIGLIVSVAVSLIELAVTWIREKRFDRFVLFDLGLIIVMALVSLLSDNSIFFKLKPAIMELVIVILLGISVYTPADLVQKMTLRYLPGFKLNNEQQQKMKRTLAVLLYLFLAHTALIVYSAFYLSNAAWGFISGVLFYIIFAVYFVIELLLNRFRSKNWERKYRDDEWFNLVDEEGRVIGKAPRSICHNGSGLLHPVVHLHVFDPQGRIYLQKRAMTKDTQPGKWDTSVGGHMHVGEPVDVALNREAMEELNLKGFKPVFIGKYIWQNTRESELVYAFYTIWSGRIDFSHDEIDEGRFWRFDQLVREIESDMFTPNFKNEFPIIMDIAKKVFRN